MDRYLYLSHLTDIKLWETNNPASLKVLLDEPLDLTDQRCEVALAQSILNTKTLPAGGFYITVCCNLVDAQTFPSNIVADHRAGTRFELQVLKVLAKEARGIGDIKERFYLPVIPTTYTRIDITLVPSEASVQLETLMLDTLLCIHLRDVKG